MFNLHRDAELTDRDNNLPEKCCEIFRSPKSGNYLFVCFNCGADYFDSFETIKVHIEDEHFNKSEYSCSAGPSDGITENLIYKNGRYAQTRLSPQLDGIIKSELIIDENEEEQDLLINAPNICVTKTEQELEEINEDPFAEHRLDELGKNQFNAAVKEEPIEFLVDPDSRDSLQCNVCDTSFTNLNILKMHAIIYHTKEVETYECLYCENIQDQFRTSKRDIFTGHLRKKHKPLYTLTKPKVFIKTKCTICTVILTSKAELIIHMKRHEDLKQYKCPTCDHSYNTKSDLRTHINRKHTTNILQCDLCNFTSKDKDNMRKHLQVVHCRIKPFKCNSCPLSFASSTFLKIHTRTHTGERICQCNVCGKSFKSIGVLNTHMHKIHDRSSYRIPCSFCDKKFHTEHNKNKHELLHTDARPYQCKTCGKYFRTADVLAQHRYLHGEKRFKCRYCDMRFSQNAGRRSHEKSRHNVD